MYSSLYLSQLIKYITFTTAGKSLAIKYVSPVTLDANYFSFTN